MRASLLALLLLPCLLVAACAEPAHVIEFRMYPGQEAVIDVNHADGPVTIRNDGTTPFEILWTPESEPARLAPGASAGRTLRGNVSLTVRPPQGLGGRGAVLVDDASGLVVSTVNVSPPATPKVVR